MEYAVIMAGGVGQRLWPLSRQDAPKQFHALTSESPLLVETAARLLPMFPWERLYVATIEHLAPLVARALPDLPAAHLLMEPEGRNTAPCLALAAAVLARRDPEAVFTAFPADHAIGSPEVLLNAVRFAQEIARAGHSVALGIVPRGPATGYGYLEVGEALAEEQGLKAYRVTRFLEKPDRATAQRLLEGGRVYWNAGIFTWRADRYLELFRVHLPEAGPALEELVAALGTPQEAEVLRACYGRLPAISVDYGIMERCEDAVVIPVEMEWSDLGDWAALYGYLAKDGDGNVAVGPHVALDTERSYLRSGGKLLVALGVQDLIVVETEDAILVCPRDRAQEVRRVIEELRRRGLERLL